MTKPDDIPQDVWNAAVETEEAAHVAYGDSLNDPFKSIEDANNSGIEVIARAIMAEREACALIADGQSASIAHPAASGTAVYIASAIRNRRATQTRDFETATIDAAGYVDFRANRN